MGAPGAARMEAAAPAGLTIAHARRIRQAFVQQSRVVDAGVGVRPTRRLHVPGTSLESLTADPRLEREEVPQCARRSGACLGLTKLAKPPPRLTLARGCRARSDDRRHLAGSVVRSVVRLR